MNDRILKLQKMMANDHVEAALYATSGNMQYFLGEDAMYYWQHSAETGSDLEADESNRHGHFLNRPDCVLYIPVDGEPVLFVSYDKYEQIFYCRLNLHNRGDIYGSYFPFVLSLCNASAKKRKIFVEAKTETINSYVFCSLGLYTQDTGMHFNEPSVDVRLSTICSAIIILVCGLYRVSAAHGLTI